LCQLFKSALKVRTANETNTFCQLTTVQKKIEGTGSTSHNTETSQRNRRPLSWHR